MKYGFIWMGLERLSQILSVVIISGGLSRAMSVENYAEWQYSFSLFTLITAITWFFGAEMLTPKIGENDEENSILVADFFIIKLFFCFFVFLFSNLYFFFLSLDFSKKYLIGLSILFLLREPLMTGFSILQFERRVQLMFIISFFCVLLRVGLLLIILKFDLPHTFYSVPWVAEGLIVGVVVFYSARIRINFSIGRIAAAIDFFKKNWIDAVFVWASLVIFVCYLKVDKIILKDVLLVKDYASYAASSQLNENISLLSVLGMQIIAPYYIYTASNKKEILSKVKKASLCYFVVLALFSLFIFMINEYLSVLIFKDVEKISILRKMVFMLPLFGLLAITNFYFYKMELYKYVIFRNIVLFFIMLSFGYSFRKFTNVIDAQILAYYASLIIVIFFDWKVIKREDISHD